MFVHLDVLSDYSFTEGASKVGGLVGKAKELDMKAIALADRNNMYGAYDFSKKAKTSGIQPIIGSRLPMKFGDNKIGYVLFLVKDETGYKNLCHLVSESNKIDSDGSKAGLKTSLFMEKNEGLIMLSGGQDGLLNMMLKEGMEQEAREAAEFFQHILGDRFYLQIDRNGKENKIIEKKLLDLAYDAELGFDQSDGSFFKGVPIVATSAVRYVNEADHDAYELVRCVERKETLVISGDKFEGKENGRYHIRSEDEMEKMFSDIPEALENTGLIAQRCFFLVGDRKPILPAFTTGEGRDEAEELAFQAREGLKARLLNKNLTAEQEEEYKKRLEYELEVIKGMGFPGYFLIVSDFIKWAKSKDIPVGPGRGSGAGSLVAWSLLITDLDPFPFGLLFERFLNPERVSMPDFDVDFCQNRREEVIHYVQDKYGSDKVAQIVTFGEIKSKNAIKDAGRVLSHERFGGYGFGEMNDLTKLIPKREDSAEPKSLKDAFETTPELIDKIQNSEKLRILYENALKIEGLFRTSGCHAAGIVIGDRPLHELLPIGWDEKTGLPVTQFNMKGAEAVGLVKFDFLGLKTLSVIKEAIDLIEEYRGIKVDISNIPLDDQEVYEMLAKGLSNGVFQFESEGMQRVLLKVKPTRIEDLIAVNALYRPGPMDQIEYYANCKNGKATPHYPSPVERTKPFLEETFGIMVYQEQVMRVAQEVAGYSLGGADLLRRAMGKKIKSEMDAQKAKFIEGATARGTSPKEAAELFDNIEKFAGYGFNKSHAAAYAYIAYQTAWLKRHYPVEFMSALLSFETDDPKRMALLKDDLDWMGIPLLPPDINKSHPRFRPEKHDKGFQGFAVRFGLNAIKKISGELKEFVEKRGRKEFVSLKDFHDRIGSYFNKGQIEKLAEAGAFDCISQTRYGAVSILSWLGSRGKTNEAQSDLFSGALDELIPENVAQVQEWGNKVDREFLAVGFFFQNHPIDAYLPRLMKAGVRRRQSFHDAMIENGIAELENRKLCGLVEEVRIKSSKRGAMFIMASIAEKKDAYNVLFFGNKDVNLNDIRAVLDQAKNNKTPVVITASMTLEDGGTNLAVFGRNAQDIETALAGIRGNFHIVIDSKSIRKTVDETMAITKAKKDFESGVLKNEEYQDIMDEINFNCASRRIAALRDYMKSIKADDENDKSGAKVEIIVQVEGFETESKLLDGKYIIDGSAENNIKTMDGVTSVFETVDKT